MVATQAWVRLVYDLLPKSIPSLQILRQREAFLQVRTSMYVGMHAHMCVYMSESEDHLECPSLETIRLVFLTQSLFTLWFPS